MESEIQPIISQRRNSVINLHRGSRHVTCCNTTRQTCLRYRAVILILIWTVIVGELQTLLDILSGGFIENYVPIIGKDKFANAVSSPIAFLYAILAVIAMLYPLSGFIADVYCGRFKTVIIGLSLIIVFSIGIVATLIGWAFTKHSHQLLSLDSFKEVAPFYFIGFSATILAIIGIAAYQANFIQLGLEQLVDDSSMSLSIFIHLAIWANALGATATAIIGAVVSCPRLNINVKIAFVAIPVLLVLCFPVLVIVSCCKHNWFYTERGQRNPYINVINVLNFVRRHNHPLFRSAFTYSGNEMPSRMDFAKERYGGPFTTEQVEDVKTFLRILSLLLSVGSIFIMEISNSYVGFKIFGLHTGNKEDFIYRCTIWVIFESSALRYLIGAIFLPFFIYIFVYFKRISVFSRIFVGFIFYMLGTLSMLAIDLAGHLHYVDDQGIGSHCMFTHTRNNNAHALTYPILKMHWSVLILPNFFLGIGPLIFLCSIFEFILAQSPHSMKGLLVGVFYMVKGLYTLISSITLIPISSDRIWSRIEHQPVINCGFVYFLFTFVVALVGLAVFSVVVKRYKYCERDDRPYDQSIVEEIFERRNRMKSPTPDYMYDDTND